jgi:hypothetical protein
MPRLVALIPKEKHLLKFAFRLISQIGIHYRNSSLSRNASLGSFPRKAPRPGDRLPFIMFQDKYKLVDIQAEVKAPALHLLLFPGTENREKINPVCKIFDEQYDLIQIKTITLTPGTRDLYESLGVQNGGYYLVRPDMYVLYRSTMFDAEHVRSFLRLKSIFSPLNTTSSTIQETKS